MDRLARALSALALLLAAAPAAGTVLAVRRRRRRWIYALALAAAGAYAVYESGISSYTNIRVDLLIIFPALGTMALLVIATLGVDLIRGRAGRGPRRTAARTRSS